MAQSKNTTSGSAPTALSGNQVANTAAAPRAADGKYTTQGVPHGYTSLTPHLAVQPAADALEFYRSVFEARILDITRMGDVIAHALLQLSNGRFTLSDPMPDYGLVAPDREQASITLAMYVTDVDEIVHRALAAGASVREPLSTFVSGDRYASIVDPFGIRWAIMTRVEDLSPEESAQRVSDWAAGQV